MSGVAAGLLVFCTSAAVLVLEILAARLLAPFVGVTLETYTAVIGVVLAGIALGSFLGGRLADRRDPRGVLGTTVMLGGALALGTVPVVNVMGPALLGGGAVSTVILALLGFFMPAAVLSAVPPMVVKLQLARLEEAGSVVGRLSALGTAGALVGTFVTGFVLVAAFPTRPVFLAVGLGLVAGGLAVHHALRADAQQQPVAGILVLGLMCGGAASLTPGPCQTETAYYCASVVDDLPPCGGRTLYLDTMRHSCVHLADPARLDFTYAQALSDLLATMAPPGQPLDALHIGGGGFALPRHLEATRPGSHSVVLELDPALVRIAREQLGLQTGPDLEVLVGDARVALDQQLDASYDLVIGDAFGGLAVPWHLTTTEVVREIARVLRPGGVYAINLIDFPPLGFARAEVATLREVFRHVAVVAPAPRLAGAQGGNFLLVASDGPVDLATLLARNRARGDDERAAEGVEVDAFVGAARPLRDDFAPVDQLLTPR